MKLGPEFLVMGSVINLVPIGCCKEKDRQNLPPDGKFSVFDG